MLTGQAVRDTGQGETGHSAFDFGKISEDINNDGMLNQEAEDYKTMQRDLDVGLDGNRTPPREPRLRIRIGRG